MDDRAPINTRHAQFADDDDHDRRSTDGHAPLKKKNTFAALRDWETGADEVSRAYVVNEMSTSHQGDGIPQVKGVKNTKSAVTNAFRRLQRASKFESIDYSEPGNDIQNSWNLERPPTDYHRAELWKWLIPCMCAVVMAFTSWAVGTTIKNLTRMKFAATEHFFAQEQFFVAYVVYIAISLTFATIAGCLVSLVSPLAAGSGISEVKTFLNGVRIPGLLAFKTFISKMVGILFTISSGIIAGKEGPFIHGGAIVGSGLGQMGSDCLQVLTGGRLNIRLPRWFGGYHRNQADHRDFTAIGTAIGVAVAFSAPIGGILFTVEEGASHYTRSSFWRAFLGTVLGVLVLELFHIMSEDFGEEGFLSIFSEKIGRMHDFSLAGDNVILTSNRFFFRLWELPIFCAMGAVGGLLGAGFINMNVWITAQRHKYIPVVKPRRRLAEVILVCFVTGTIWFLVNYQSPCVDVPAGMFGYHNASAMAGERHHARGTNATVVEMLTTEATDAPEGAPGGHGGHGAPHSREFRPASIGEELIEGIAYVKYNGELLSSTPVTSLYPRLNCPEGQYSKFGQIFFCDLATALRRMIGLGAVSDNETNKDTGGMLDPANLPLDVVVTFFVLVYFLLTWTYGIGCASGLFVPSLTLGGAFGLMWAHLVNATIGKWYNVVIPFPTYAVVGTGATLGGATRMTVSITLLIAETTGAMQLLIPLMLTIFCAKLVGDRFNESIYDVHIHIRGSPILEEASLVPHQKMITDKLVASDMMTEGIIALPLRPKVSDVIHLLKTKDHSSYAVTFASEVEKARDGSPFLLAGSIRRQTLARLLKHRLGVIHPDKQREYDQQMGTGHDGVNGSGGMRGKSMRLSNPGSPIATGRDGVSQNVKLAVLESRLDSAIAPAMQVMQETGLTHLQILEKLEDFPFKIKAPEMEAIFEKYSEDEKETLIVNLEPFMDRDPPVCGRSENLSRTYQRLRTMGYHHLYVMDSLPLVTGIITRKDVMEDSTKLKLGEKANRLNISLDDPSYLLTEMPYLPHRNQKKSTAFNNGQEDSGDDEDEEMTKEGDPGHIVV